MSDDYLFDRSGPPDPDVERLEQMLGRLRSTPPVPDLSKVHGRATMVRLMPDATYLGIRFPPPALAAAAATATDLGCSYMLHVDEDGSGLLSVEKGWVALESNGLESFVPAGASCRTDPTRGPGTPFYDDADEAFRDALEQFDYGRDPARR